MSYHHLTTFERGRIQELLSLGYSHRKIAQKLNRHRSCIDTERFIAAQLNENSNGLLRESYAKKTDLASVRQEDLTHNLFLINSRPRKCLGWKSPIQVFLHEVAHLT